MRIKVLFTGGTIGSSVGEGVISTDTAAAGKLLIDNYLKHSTSPNRDKVDFVVEEPYTCLSEDLTVETWNKLIVALRGLHWDHYDGLIITHGTDTMAYTANLLSILLAGVHLPVVLVGSNYVLTDKRANGNQNFSDAVDFIASRSYPGVYVIFSGRVYLGSRILQCRSFTDEYPTVSGADFAHMENGKILPVEDRFNPTEEQVLSVSGALRPLVYEIPPLRPSVMLLQPYVGLDYRDIRPGAQIQAVLHGLYHSATACVGEDGPLSQNSILSLCKRCQEEGKLLFIAPFKQALLENEDQYATTSEMLRYGVQMACDMSVEAAYAKLLIATVLYGADGEKCAAFMNQNFFFERLIEY